MTSVASTRTITVRLPRELYQQTTELAHRRNQSVNAVVQEGVQKLLREEEIRAVSDGFDLLAQHPDECDVEFALAAQAEVVLRDEH